MAEVKRLSASKLVTLFNCSFAYYLKYIQHEEIPQNVQLVFGKAIHYLLDKFYKVNYKSPETFSKFWKYYWFNLISGDFLKGKKKESLKVKAYPYIGKNENRERIEKKLLVGDHIKFFSDDPIGAFFGYLGLGSRILENFYIKHKDKPPPIEREKRIYMNLFGHNLVAILDRIDKYQGAYYLTDYKTNKRLPEQNSFLLHKHPQFTIYSKVFREIYQEKEKSILYYHLRTGKILKTHRDKEDYDYIKLLMDKAQEKIEKDDFLPFYGFHCNYCDYKIPCQKYDFSKKGPEKNSRKQDNKIEYFLGWEEQLNPNEKKAWLEIAEER